MVASGPIWFKRYSGGGGGGGGEVRWETVVPTLCTERGGEIPSDDDNRHLTHTRGIAAQYSLDNVREVTVMIELKKLRTLAI
jgi:hypothetical protein